MRAGIKRAGAFAGFFLCLAAGAAGARQTEIPRSVEAIAAGTGAIRVYWLPVPNAQGYEILRDGSFLADTPAAAREYEDTTIAPGSQHTYQIQPLISADAPALPSSGYTERAFAPFPAAEKRGQIPVESFDVVIVQASSGGVAAAYEAARRGLKTALIEPTTRLGGMPVNGLSATDLRGDTHQSGFFVRFRQRVIELYAAEGAKENGRKYEPRIAHQAMKSLLYEFPNLTIYRRTRLFRVKSKASAADETRRVVTGILIDELDAQGYPTGKRAELRAKIFIDSTDCGDLAAGAEAPFHLGREPRTKREPHNGVIYYERKTQTLLPGSTGAGDRRIQAYSYLVTVKDYGPDADKTIAKPPHYRREDYLDPMLPDWKSSWASDSGVMPNAKYELNQHPHGNDLQEVNYPYPTANYETRARIEAKFRERALGYMYYIQTEYGKKSLGLPDDEYRDSGGFPPLLYVREGRRIAGEQRPDETDITDARSIFRPESVGLGDYPMDSHAARRKTDSDTRNLGEGEWWLLQQTPWHQLPLGVIVPQKLDNVFVTTAVSSTHVSYGTYRMEPVRMAFGQAAGIAASIAIKFHKTAREVPARQVQDELLPHSANPYGDPNGVLHYFPDVPPTHKYYRSIQFLACRGFLPGGEKFLPDAPVTPAELERWLNLLSARANPADYFLDTKRKHFTVPFNPWAYAAPRYSPGYMGTALQTKFVWRYNPQDKTVSRAKFLHCLRQLLPAAPDYTDFLIFNDFRNDPYTDTDGVKFGDDSNRNLGFRSEARFLHEWGIDSRLWDSWDAYAPDGKLRLQPDKPVTRGEAFAAFYVAQIALGPLFNDHPADSVNGRRVPPAPLANP